MIYTNTPDIRLEATDLYEQGWSIAAIASELQRPHSTVWGWFNTSTDDYKIKEWKGKATDDEKQMAVVHYQHLGTIPKVCEVMDRSYDTVRRWLKEAGVDTSPKKSKSGGKKVLQLKQRVEDLEAENARLREALAVLIK
jgi:transposase-like protein